MITVFQTLLLSIIIININLISAQTQAPPAPAAKAPHWCPPTHPYQGGPQPGPYGQDCTPPQGDCPGKCPVTNGVFSSYIATGKLECGINYDCCTCRLMECNECGELSCNGDQGCYGAGNIVINGAASGALINCNGDVSCAETVITGTNIGSISCSGDDSCKFARMTLTCLPSGCIIGCGGPDSCRSDLTLGKYAVFLITNSNGLDCGRDSCANGYFRLTNNKGGFIGCSAPRACQGATIIADQNIASMTCAGVDACNGAGVYLTNPSPSFSLFCGATNACKGATIYITITDPTIETLGSIQCNAPSACEGTRIIIQTGGRYPRTQTLTIPSLGCGGPRACANLAITKSVNVKFTSCGCGAAAAATALVADRPCEGLTGLPQCHA